MCGILIRGLIFCVFIMLLIMMEVAWRVLGMLKVGLLDLEVNTLSKILCIMVIILALIMMIIKVRLPCSNRFYVIILILILMVMLNSVYAVLVLWPLKKTMRFVC